MLPGFLRWCENVRCILRPCPEVVGSDLVRGAWGKCRDKGGAVCPRREAQSMGKAADIVACHDLSAHPHTQKTNMGFRSHVASFRGSPRKLSL